MNKHFSIIYIIKIEINNYIQQIASKKEPKYSPMSEGNTCIAEPNVEVLPLNNSVKD